MKIINATKYRTADFAAIIQRVAQDELDPEQRKRLVATIRYRRTGDGSHTYGRCTSSGVFPSFSMYISRHSAVARFDLNPFAFAHAVAHEMAHCRGMKHDQMRGKDSKYDWRGPQDSFAWARALPPIREKEQKQAPRPGPQTKLAHAQAMLAAKERQARRLAGLIRKWRRKVGYYEQKLAAVRTGSAARASQKIGL